MSHIRSKNTRVEVAFRKLLWNNKIRGYRVNSTLIGKPDIFFTRKKVAVFIDGCYWHKCPLDYKPAKTNQDYWIEKIDNNVKRDLKNNEILKSQGITVIRFWEHEVKKTPDLCLEKIKNLILDQ